VTTSARTYTTRRGTIRAKVASTYRRLQRFFQQVLLPDDWSVGIVMALIGNPDRWYLCMDRTNWKIGKSDVKILMLAVVTERYRVPLMWAFLGHPGNSTTQQRIALMLRYLTFFKASSVRMFLADREFIGQEWFKFLKDQGIPFVIRVKNEQLINRGSSGSMGWPIRRSASTHTSFRVWTMICAPDRVES
jgi:hypothetical protein